MNRLRIGAARAVSITGVCALILLSVASPSLAASTTSLTASGTGAQEVPAAAAGDTLAATVDIDLQTGTLTYMVSFQGSEPAVASHIHKGKAGVSGPVVVPLDEAVVNAGRTGTIKIDKKLAAAIVADPASYYVNVHTASHQSGAARGQLTAGTGTVPTGVNAGTGGLFAAAKDSMDASTIALLLGAALLVIGAAGAFGVRKRHS